MQVYTISQPVVYLSQSDASKIYVPVQTPVSQYPNFQNVVVKPNNLPNSYYSQTPSPLPITPSPPVYSNNLNNSNSTNTNEGINKNTNSLWHSGLFDCFSDLGICCKGLLCPCVLYGQNVKMLDGSDCCCNCIGYLLCCPPCLETSFRRRLRLKYNLPVDPCSDCCVGWFCTPCGLCQEARELDYHLSQPGQQIMR